MLSYVTIQKNCDVVVHGVMVVYLIEVKNAFEIGYRDQPKSVFVCKNEGEKSEWMSVLMTLYMQR